MTYHFERLSDFDFEQLSRDLLEAELGLRFEHFTRGRDSGIDLRYSAVSAARILFPQAAIPPPAPGKTIVQCKHYSSTGYNGLKSNLKNKELPKIRQLKPERLILVTSVGLTPGRKGDLAALLAPFVRDESDIIGLTEIEALIAKHPIVERRHFKLWLTSTSVLDRLLNSAVYTHTEFLQRDVEEKAKRYVQNDSFPRALKLLEDHRVCVIAGPPGIGKTTLAQMLMVHLVATEDYEPVMVSEDISEASTVWNPEAKQLFYYDDFLGQTASHEKLGKNEDTRLTMFLRSASKSHNKLAILTTREYILEQARGRYERLAHADFGPWKYTVTLSDYTKRHRAQILYNHLYFSDLPKEMLRALRDSKAYRRIVDHDNYNPRLIEHVANMARARCSNPVEFPDFVLSVLSEPEQLWQHPFDYQLDNDAREVLAVLATLPVQTELEALRRTAAARVPLLGTERAFRAALRILDGDFLRTQRADGLNLVRFANPAVRDFVIGRLRRDVPLTRSLLQSAVHFEQTTLIVGYVEELAISTEYHDAIRRTIGAPSCVVITLPNQFGVKSSHLEGASHESRLRDVLATHPGVDSVWLHAQLEVLRGRWAQGHFAEETKDLLQLLGDVFDKEAFADVLRTVRDGLLKGFDLLHYAWLWCWVRDAQPDLASEDQLEAAGDLFAQCADAEIEALAQLDEEGSIEGGREDLLGAAEAFGLDATSFDFERIDERLRSLGERDSAYEDEWRDNRHEERSEREGDDRFIDGLFDGLADDD